MDAGEAAAAGHAAQRDDAARGPIRSQQELAAGLFLIAVAAIALFAVWSLPVGTWNSPGPGLAPRATAFGLAAFGVLLVASAFLTVGERLERWHLRGPFFVLGSIVVFALTIRSLGLIVAGPLAVIISGLADPHVRAREILPFAVVMTLLCIGLFSYILKLPIPVAPWWH